ncbi:MAG: S4 domain-containing protein YaaA [Mycoplasma sp.]
MTKAIKVKIHTEYIQLQQLLKLVNLIDSGAMAKNFIASHEILVNGYQEYRRGKKLYPHDQISINGVSYVIEME